MPPPAVCSSPFQPCLAVGYRTLQDITVYGPGGWVRLSPLASTWCSCLARGPAYGKCNFVRRAQAVECGSWCLACSSRATHPLTPPRSLAPLSLASLAPLPFLPCTRFHPHSKPTPFTGPTHFSEVREVEFGICLPSCLLAAEAVRGYEGGRRQREEGLLLL